MIKLYDYETEKALPIEMKTPERIAILYAFDKQKKKIIDKMKVLNIWSNINDVSEDKLDFLAVENRVLLYNSALDPEVKRNLIKNYLHWYMKLGTKSAMEEIFDTIYPNDTTTISEWYEYDGEPFHFKITTTAKMEVDFQLSFDQLIRIVKNARSRLDQIYALRNIDAVYYAATDTISRIRNPAVKEGYELKRTLTQESNFKSVPTYCYKNPPVETAIV